MLLRRQARRHRGVLTAWWLTALDLSNIALNGVAERLATVGHRPPAGGPRVQRPANKDESPMSSFVQDLRYALRTLMKQPGFTVVVVLTVSLGVGATTAMFSIVNGVLLQPLPYHNADELVRVWESDRFNQTQREGVSGPDYFDFLAQQTVFSSMAAWAGLNPTLTGGGADPERLSAVRVTHTLLPTFGIQPVLGRGFTPADDSPGGALVAMVSEGLWTRRFGSDPAIVGKTVQLDGNQYVITGVLPSDNQYFAGVDLWVPLQYSTTTSSRGVHNLGTVARLRDGISVEHAQAEMTRIMAALEEQYPDDNVGRGATVDPLAATITGRVRPALLMLMGAVVLVLLIACANVANLLLARGAARQREMAVRVALGAGRARLTRQLLVESLVLATIGGVGGVAVAIGSLRLLRRLQPAGLPRLNDVVLSPTVLAFALGVTVLTGIAFGLLPALRASRPRLGDALAEGGRSSAGRTTGTIRSGLAVVQVAVAFMLVVGAGLLMKSMWNLTRVDPGFRYQELVKLTVNLPQARYPSNFRQWPEAPEVKQFYADVRERALSRVPSVTAAALALNHPANPGWTTRISFPTGPQTVEEGVEEERIRPISDGYFATIGTPLTRGRDFTSFDRGESPPVVIVNETFVRKYFPDDDPIGSQLTFWGTDREIVGVVADVRFMGLNAPSEPAVYAPMSQLPFSGFDIVLRATAPPAHVIQAMRGEIAELDPELAVFAAQSFEEILAGSLGSQRFNMIMLGLFAAVALLLAAVGIYGVVSYGVSCRMHEFGVRMSLGADRGQVSRLVVQQAFTLAGVGVLLGLAGALAVSRVLRGLLYDVAPTDIPTLGGVALFLSAVAIVAALVPAYRASRVDPMVTLRRD